MREPGVDIIHQVVDAAVKRVCERPREQAALLGTLEQTQNELFASGRVLDSEQGEKWLARRETAVAAASALLDRIEDTLPQLFDDEDRQTYLHDAARFLAVPLGRFDEARAFALRLDNPNHRRDRLNQIIYKSGLSGQLEIAERCLDDLAPKDRPRGLLTLAATQRPPVEPGETPNVADETVAAAVERTGVILRRVPAALAQASELSLFERTWILANGATLYKMIGRPADGEPLLGQALAEIPNEAQSVDKELKAIAGCARESRLFSLSVHAASRCQSPTQRSYHLSRACELMPGELAQLSAAERERLLTLIETSAAEIPSRREREAQQELLVQIRRNLGAAGEPLPIEEIVEPPEGE